MTVFHQIDPWDLERSERHLWVLALGTIFAFIVAIAFLVYPTVFLQPVTLGGGTVQKLFVGFCVLAGLLFGYLLERHFLITRLRRQLREEKRKVREAHLESSVSLMESLPRFQQFQGRLALEFHLAESTHQSLSLLVVAIKLRPNLAETAIAENVIEKAAQALVRKLRGEDSVYLIGATNFCVVLPDVSEKTASLISGRVSEGLDAASGLGIRFSFEIHALNYPALVHDEFELEVALRPYVEKPDEESTDAAPVLP
jgi:GGDEF domain-containing protein